MASEVLIHEFIGINSVQGWLEIYLIEGDDRLDDPVIVILFWLAIPAVASTLVPDDEPISALQKSS
ncbi:hypothetical protein H4Q26_009672 [Puccinia striiformis f. sp. tritici PST-130]|nr:hypothetical protein H4Q26_009672 [Puccinia striiformis f. sp. tritici PST-130]